MDHYEKHGAEFDPMTPEEYQATADAFIGGPLDPLTTWQCRRRNGDTLRYYEETDEFAIMDRDGFIVTYFRPDPEETRAA